MALYIIKEDCINCGVCEDECPTDAISQSESGDYYEIDPSLCTECAACQPVCPADCIVSDPNHKESEEELQAKLLRLSARKKN